MAWELRITSTIGMEEFIYRVVQLNFTPEFKYYVCCLIELLLFLQ